MGGVLWLYQTKELFIISAPDTDVIDVDRLWTAGHKKEN